MPALQSQFYDVFNYGHYSYINGGLGCTGGSSARIAGLFLPFHLLVCREFERQLARSWPQRNYQQTMLYLVLSQVIFKSSGVLTDNYCNSNYSLYENRVYDDGQSSRYAGLDIDRNIAFWLALMAGSGGSSCGLRGLSGRECEELLQLLPFQVESDVESGNQSSDSPEGTTTNSSSGASIDEISLKLKLPSISSSCAALLSRAVAAVRSPHFKVAQTALVMFLHSHANFAGCLGCCGPEVARSNNCLKHSLVDTLRPGSAAAQSMQTFMYQKLSLFQELSQCYYPEFIMHVQKQHLAMAIEPVPSGFSCLGLDLIRNYSDEVNGEGEEEASSAAAAALWSALSSPMAVLDKERQRISLSLFQNLRDNKSVCWHPSVRQRTNELFELLFELVQSREEEEEEEDAAMAASNGAYDE